MKLFQKVLGGRWDSPFFLETERVKEAPGAGAIPAPATFLLFSRYVRLFILSVYVSLLRDYVV